jgi:uncharacterized protein with HEPN domain
MVIFTELCKGLGYDQVDLDILWDTIEDDLPPLITKLEKILESK